MTIETLDGAGSPRADSIAGWQWTFAAGAVPLLAGVMTLVIAWSSMLRPGQRWGLSFAPLSFTFGDLLAASPSAAAYVELSSSVGGVNIVAAAVGVMVVSRYALRAGARWAWFFLLFALLWVGVHDAWSAWRFHVATGDISFVMPFTYCTLMTVGLWRTSRAVLPHAAASRMASSTPAA